MKSIFFMMFSIVRAVPLCTNCKFFKPNLLKSEFGKCVKFPKSEENYSFLVNGKVKFTPQDYYYCTTARGTYSMCGPPGKLFESK